MYYSNLAELKVGESANFCHGVEIGTKMQKKHTYRLISEKSAGNLNLYEFRPHDSSTFRPAAFGRRRNQQLSKRTTQRSWKKHKSSSLRFPALSNTIYSIKIFLCLLFCVGPKL
jgi:hypothetical protein